MAQSFPFVSRIPGSGAKLPNGYSSGVTSPLALTQSTQVNGETGDTVTGPERKEKVIVVGAGIAGLRAASVLHRHGVEVVVLEGRDRIGGRIWTVREDDNGKSGVIRDMGAAWLHETARNPLTKLIGELGMGWYYDDGVPAYYTRYGRTGAQFKAKKAAEEFADYAEWYYERNPTAKDRSVDDFIKKFVRKHELIGEDERLWAPQAIRDVEHMLGTTTAEASAKHFTYFGWPERNLYVKDGYDRIVEWTCRPLRTVEGALKLNSVVQQVDWNENGPVTVQYKSADSDEPRVVSADAVVIAAPLGSLQHNSISFNPSLPDDIRHGISKVSYAALGKVFFEFSEVFWSKENDQLIYIPSPTQVETDDETASSSSESSKGTDTILNYATTTVNLSLITENSKELCIQIVEPVTQRIEAMSNDWGKIYRFFLPLFKLLRTESSKALPRLVNIAVTGWTLDPMAGYGAFPTEKVGDEPELLLEALQNHSDSRLQFAGDHCAEAGLGCVHGAFSSGEVAAMNLLSTFGVPYDGGDLVTLRCEIDSDDEEK